MPRKVKPRLQHWREAGERIDNREHPKLAPNCQLIMDKVHGYVSLDRVAFLRLSRSLALTRRLSKDRSVCERLRFMVRSSAKMNFRLD
jgi:hypothetical protein